jgi:hypothetical protein
MCVLQMVVMEVHIGSMGQCHCFRRGGLVEMGDRVATTWPVGHAM